MRSARTLLLVAVTTATVVLTGCSTTVAGSPAPAQNASGAGAGAATAAPTSDPVAWTNGVCGSLLPFVKSVTTQPQIDQANPSSAVKSFSDYLGRSISGIDEALTNLDAVGPAPVAGGAAIVSRLKDTLTTVKSSFTKSKAIIDKVDPNDVQQLGTALPQALAPLQDLSTLKNPLADLQVDPTLDAAANQAPNCQAINKLN